MFVRTPTSGQRSWAKALLVLSLMSILISAPGGSLHAEADSFPTEFFIVSEVTSDASPFWYHYILRVTSVGQDALVTYIRIAPMDQVCAESITVKAATRKLPGVQPADLLSAYHICEVDSGSLSREIRRRTRTAAIDDSVKFGIVANCGAKDVVIHLPYPEQVGLDELRKKSPQLARWWDLQGLVKQKAFGSSQVFSDVFPQAEQQLQQDGETVISGLRSGRFDKGLQSRGGFGNAFGRRPSFRDDLIGYVGPVGSRGQTPKLTQANQYRFKNYVDPKYPPLAMQARISGIVKMDLSVDTLTGEVRDVHINSGHPLFTESVMSAARLWQFEPDGFTGGSQHIPAELVFEFHCPEPLSQ